MNGPNSMPDSLSEVRERIHRKSREYFVFDYSRREPAKWKMFYGATDALLDAGAAAASYRAAITSDTGGNLLACYGFLQALFIQQDAVLTLSRAVGLDWHPNEDTRLKEIREARNRLTGHPALAGEREKRFSSAIIPYYDITQYGFRGHVYYHDGTQDIEVEASSFLKDNEERLALQLEVIEKRMNQDERQFRSEQSARPLSSCFENGFSYLLQRLHCDLLDEYRVVQSRTHAQMMRERITTLQVELKDRGFGSTAASFDIERILTGISLIEKILDQASSPENNQHELDLIFDGLEKRVGSLEDLFGDIDTRLRTSIP